MQRTVYIFMLLAGLLLTGTTLEAQTPTIRYVKVDGSGSKDGTSWANASDDLQAMVNACASGDQVRVAAGAYTRNNGDGNSFIMKDGVNVYGGFPAEATNATDMDDRTLPTAQTQTNLTILKGGEGLRVLYQSDVFSTLTTWDGFIIQDAILTSRHGAGAYLRANGELKNCVIRRNMITE